MDHTEVSAEHQAGAPKPRKTDELFRKTCRLIEPNGWERYLSRKYTEVIIELWLAGLATIPLTLAQLNEKLSKPYKGQQAEATLFDAVMNIMPLAARYLPMYRIEQCGTDKQKMFAMCRRERGAASGVKWDIRKHEDGRQTIFPCG